MKKGQEQFLNIVARLMASENVGIIHDERATTASMDLVRRTLTLPQWENMSDDLYEMLVSHEIGHALWTPLEGWHKSLSEHGMMFKSFLNVVEDVRIERLIKEKFPGVVRKFHSAYAELLDRDFFGLKAHGISVDDLPFIDRLNISAKVGTLLGVHFSREEQLLVDRSKQLETFEEVKEFALQLFNARHQMRKSKKNPFGGHLRDLLSGFGISADAEDDEYESDVDEAADEQEEEAQEFNDAERKNINIDVDAPEEELAEGITDSAFREAEERLAVKPASIAYYGSRIRTFNLKVPDYKLSNYVVPFSKVIEKINDQERYHTEKPATHAATLKEFLNKETKTINHLVNEFNMKRDARRFARAHQAKSGQLDMKKLANYKLVDDLFKRISVVPKGKNHGMVMIFDQSSSMEDVYSPCIEQIIVLLEFCRRLNIPAELYGFSDNPFGREPYGMPDLSAEENKLEANEVMLGDNLHLKQYFAAGMNDRQYMAALQAFWSLRKEHRNIICEKLHATPLNGAIILSRQLVRQFELKTRVDVTNVVVLTDGAAGDRPVNAEAHGFDNIFYACEGYMSKPRRSNNSEATTATLVDLMKRVTGANYVGIYITMPHRTRNLATSIAVHTEDYLSTNKKMVGDPKKDFAVMTQNFGFDSYFICRTPTRHVAAIASVVDKDANATKMAQQFSKHANDTQSHRAFLSLFATEISSAKHH